MTKTYDFGETIQLEAAFEDPDTDLPVSPASVTCQVRRPDGTIDTPNANETSPGSGIYRAYYDPPAPGEYSYRLLGVDARSAAGTGRFRVRANPMA